MKKLTLSVAICLMGALSFAGNAPVANETIIVQPADNGVEAEIVITAVGFGGLTGKGVITATGRTVNFLNLTGKPITVGSTGVVMLVEAIQDEAKGFSSLIR